MKLNKHWSIEYDANQVILVESEYRNNKKGQLTEYRTEYYYATVKQALVAFLNKSLKGTENIEEIVKKIDAVEKLINEM